MESWKGVVEEPNHTMARKTGGDKAERISKMPPSSPLR
jgi:hypothetical protein